MKKFILILFALLPLFAFGQNNIKKTAAVAYTAGAPTFTPAIASSTELAVDTVTSQLYWWSRNGSTWVKYPRGVDIISGSVAPAYTPRDNQALFAINADNEFYYYTGASWTQIGANDTTATANIYTTNGTFDDSLRTVSVLKSLILRCTDTTGFVRIQYGLLKGSRINANYDSLGVYYNGVNNAYASVRDTAATLAFTNGSGSSLFKASPVGVTIQSGQQIKLKNGANTITYASGTLTEAGSSPAIAISDAASSSSTSGGLLSLGSFDNAANVFGDRLGKISFKGQTNGSGGTGTGASIQAFSFATWTGSATPGALSFYTTEPATLTETERGRFYSSTFRLRNNTSLGFDNSGNTILIYTLSPTADSALELSTSTGAEFRLSGKFGFSGVASVYTTSKNNLFLGPYTYFSLTASTTDINITGAVRSSVIQNNRVAYFYNNGGAGAQLHDIVFKNESASSTAANRFALPDSADIRLKPYESIGFIYDNNLTRWVVTHYTPGRTSGTATLVAGTVTVNTPAVRTGSIIQVTCNTPGGTQGILSVPSASITNATSFVINSSSGADTSTVNWTIIK